MDPKKEVSSDILTIATSVSRGVSDKNEVVGRGVAILRSRVDLISVVRCV